MASTPQPDLPATMRVLQMTSYGDADVLQYVEARTPQLLLPTDIIIQVHAAGVNPVEAKVRQGNMALVLKPTFPCVIGGDYCGTIVSKGDKVEGFNIGDQVFGTLPDSIGRSAGGSYAEYARIPLAKSAIALKPANISTAEAGAAGIAVLTAWESLIHQGKLKTLSSPRIIVVGAAGGLGIYGIQIAKAYGANVVAICSGKNADLVTRFGADVVLDYTIENSVAEFVNKEKGTFDIIFDAVGGDDYWNLLALALKPSGVYSSAVGPIQYSGSAKFGLMDLAKTVATITGRKIFSSRKYEIIIGLSHGDMPEIAKMFEEGKIQSYVPQEQMIPLKNGAKAHEMIETHRTVGKIVLVMD